MTSRSQNLKSFINLEEGFSFAFHKPPPLNGHRPYFYDIFLIFVVVEIVVKFLFDEKCLLSEIVCYNFGGF